MKALLALLASPTTWHFIAVALASLTVAFPHAQTLASLAQDIGMNADKGNVAGAASALATASIGFGLHLYQHGKSQAESNAPPQTGATPN